MLNFLTKNHLSNLSQPGELRRLMRLSRSTAAEDTRPQPETDSLRTYAKGDTIIYRPLHTEEIIYRSVNKYTSTYCTGYTVM
jgi:hypothetical protein